MTRRALLPVALAAALAAPAGDARASDFWDEVTEPGLPAHRTAVARAESAYRARRFEEAERFAREAVEVREERSEGHVVLALALGALGRHADAVAHVRRARELAPSAFDDAVRGADAVRIAVRAEDWPLAADVLARLTVAMPAEPTRRLLFADAGDVLQTLGPSYSASSLRAYEAALRDGRGYEPRAALGLALALHRNGREGEVAPLVALAVESGRVETILSNVAGPSAEKSARLALLHEAAGRTPEAIAAWGEAARRGEWAEHARAQIARLERARVGSAR